MPSREEATKLAREKLQKAEKTLADYAPGAELNRERLNQLALAVMSARRELLNLLAGLPPEGNEHGS